MSSSRRSSKQQDTGSEFFLECKAAFLAVYDDIGDKIESKKRLNIGRGMLYTLILFVELITLLTSLYRYTFITWANIVPLMACD
jgi:hypothetical protein